MKKSLISSHSAYHRPRDKLVTYYVNDKPVLLVCDNTVFVKIVPELAALMADAERGLPYEGAKEHYILDIDDTDLARQVVAVLETVTPLPKPKKKKAE